MGHTRKAPLMGPFLKTTLGRGQVGEMTHLVKYHKHEARVWILRYSTLKTNPGTAV